MSDLREKLADVICSNRAVDNWQATPSDYDLADAIIGDLPDMVQPLVWYNAGPEIQSQSLIHFYRVYANSAGGYTLDDNEAYSAHRSQDEAKAAAQAHHVAQIMAALGMGVE